MVRVAVFKRIGAVDAFDGTVGALQGTFAGVVAALMGGGGVGEGQMAQTGGCLNKFSW